MGRASPAVFILRSLFALTIALQETFASAQDATPPRVLALEDVVLGAEHDDAIAAAGGAITGTLIVGVDGAAQLESCDAAPVLCDAVEEVLARARFEPASRGGAGSRVRAATAPPLSDVATSDTDDPVAPEPSAPDVPSFRARAEVERVPAGSRRFALEELRDVPGAFGDPFRTVDAMPGVVPVTTGLPYVYVRGAPPAGTLYAYDGIPLPALFHLGVGPAVVHPRMIGELRVHPGAAPARYGRMVGGVIAADPPPGAGSLERARGEVELRLLDVNGYVEAPIDGGGEVRAAVRWGWPGLVIGQIVKDTELFYGDYQLRAHAALSRIDRVEIVALGSYDELSFHYASGEPSRTQIHFQRAEVRLVRRLDRLELGLALRAAYDHSSITGSTVMSDPLNPLELSIEAGTIGPRLWAAWRGEGVRVAGGAELFGTFGRPSERLRNIPGFPASPDAIFVESSTRSVVAGWLEVGFDPLPELAIDVGGRIDTWTTGDVIEGAIDPRARVVWHVIPELDLHAGAGVARQPATFYVPLPGLSDVSMDRGLQTSIQGELGGRVTFAPFEGELTLFAHHYDQLLFTDAFLLVDATRAICAGAGSSCIPVQPDPRTSGTSWGGELFLRIAPDQPVSGFVSYTLAWIELEPVHGLPYRASFDIRHVLNVVARWEIVPGLTLGGRVFVRSGMAAGTFWVSQRDVALHRHTQELDAFVRLDANLAYAWDAGWARLRVSAEWLNVTMSREQNGIACPTGPVNGRCPVVNGELVFAPNIGLRAEL